MGNKTAVNIDCTQQVESAAGHRIHCVYDFHLLRSDELGLGPYLGRYTDFDVRGGEIVAAYTVDLGSHGPTPSPSSTQVWEPFRRWMLAEHPDDVAVMYDGCCIPRPSRASIVLWDQRSREYVVFEKGE
jgi:hypothetical protein